MSKENALNEGFKKNEVDLGERFFDLVGLLSSIRNVLEIRFQPASEGQLLYLALYSLVENLHLQNCSIFLKSDQGLTCEAGVGFSELVDSKTSEVTSAGYASIKGTVFKPGEGIIGLAFESKEVQYAADCRNDGRFIVIKGIDKEIQEGSLVSVPLMNMGEAIGVLNVFHSQKDYFDTWQCSALSLFGDAVTQLLINYRLVKELDHKVAARTAALERALGQSSIARDQMEKLSMTDELTGLMNRRSFFKSSSPLISRAIRMKSNLGVMLIDLDNFKSVNDNWGHLFGDRVLQQVSSILAAELRDADILARLGGEEFIILLPDTEKAGVVHLVERIQDSLNDIDSTADDSEIGVTASYGITFLDDGYSQLDAVDVLEKLYDISDKAMYQSKDKGKNTWTII